MKKMNTRFVAFIAASIDGKISLARNKMPDWTSREDWAFFQKEIGKYDAVVVGRNTFKCAEKNLRKRNTFVFTRRVKGIVYEKGITFLNPEKVNVKEIFSQFKSVAILGGPAAYGFMIENNMLDEIYLTVEPLIFGTGKVEMFYELKKTRFLKLVESKKLNKAGSMLLHYKVV